MTDARAFILHLARASARRPGVEALIAALPLESAVVEAVDGAALAAADIGAAYAPRRYAPAYPFALHRGEIGVFLSHRKAWARILAEGLDFGVVFEDDAGLDPAAFAAALAFLRANRSRWSYVHLPGRDAPPGGRTVATAGGLTLLRPDLPPLRAIGQFVSREAAERLLAASAPFDRPVDSFLQMPWASGQELLSLMPTPIRDRSAESGGTTIGRRKGLAERLRHEALRPLYRARVRAAYRAWLGEREAGAGG